MKITHSLLIALGMSLLGAVMVLMATGSIANAIFAGLIGMTIGALIFGVTYATGSSKE